MLQFFAFLRELFGVVGQFAENKGAKIPLKADEIKQRAENNANGLRRKESAVKWLAQVKFYNHWLRPTQSLHAKNQVRDLIDSQADILSITIDIRTVGKRTGNWLIITYMRDEYKREYLIEAK